MLFIFKSFSIAYFDPHCQNGPSPQYTTPTFINRGSLISGEINDENIHPDDNLQEKLLTLLRYVKNR